MTLNKKDTALYHSVVARRHRISRLPGERIGAGQALTRRLDAVLLSEGFKLSADAAWSLANSHPDYVLEIALLVLPAIREMTGSHSVHNTYFRDFPANVPDTREFIEGLIREAVTVNVPKGEPDPWIDKPWEAGGGINLLALPGYGTYNHTYEEMVAAHSAFVAAAGDRVTILKLGLDLPAEVANLAEWLASSRVPLSGEDRDLLRRTAPFSGALDPLGTPVRENRAIVNAARLRRGMNPLGDTVTDVLRMACELSDGDPTLDTPTHFASFSRPQRLAIMEMLENVFRGGTSAHYGRGLGHSSRMDRTVLATDMIYPVVRAGGSAHWMRLADVLAHREAWKRLGSHVHPHEHRYAHCTSARDVFAVASGDLSVRSAQSAVVKLISSGQSGEAARLLNVSPGRLFRSLDWLLRQAETTSEKVAVLDEAERRIHDVSGRVLLGVREHFLNRGAWHVGQTRLFVNSKGKAWVKDEQRSIFPASLLEALSEMIDSELARRLPKIERLVIEPEMAQVALPLSQKSVPGGLGILPRGSVMPVHGNTVRVFTHWCQAEQRTDFDLSALLVNDDYSSAGHVSWTNYRGGGGAATYSGDLTSAPAPDGASEFIDVRLDRIAAGFVLPSIYHYSGESFLDAAESYFGYMTLDADQAGKPFEPATVRAKSEMRGAGEVSLPLVVMKDEVSGQWQVKWIHLFLRGHANFSTVERHKLTTSLLMRSVIERRYLTVAYWARLAAPSGADPGAWPADQPVTYIGLGEPPAPLAEGSTLITPVNLTDLIPD